MKKLALILIAITLTTSAFSRKRTHSRSDLMMEFMQMLDGDEITWVDWVPCNGNLYTYKQDGKVIGYRLTKRHILKHMRTGKLRYGYGIICDCLAGE